MQDENISIRKALFLACGDFNSLLRRKAWAAPARPLDSIPGPLPSFFLPATTRFSFVGLLFTDNETSAVNKFVCRIVFSNECFFQHLSCAGFLLAKSKQKHLFEHFLYIGKIPKCENFCAQLQVAGADPGSLREVGVCVIDRDKIRTEL